MTMNADLKQRWVTALRSGEYEQGAGALYYEGRYCCLGVLCEITKEEFNIQVEECSGYRRYNLQTAMPDGKLLGDLFGMHGRVPLVTIDNSYKHLQEHNDRGVPFSKIADAIEAQL